MRALPGVGHLAYRCVGPRLRVLPLTPQIAFSLQSGENGFPSARSRRFLSGFACRTRSPLQPGPCVFRTRLGTFRRGRLASPASACWFPVATVTFEVTGIERAGRNFCPVPSSLRWRPISSPIPHQGNGPRRRRPSSPFACSSRCDPGREKEVTYACRNATRKTRRPTGAKLPAVLDH